MATDNEASSNMNNTKDEKGSWRAPTAEENILVALNGNFNSNVKSLIKDNAKTSRDVGARQVRIKREDRIKWKAATHADMKEVGFKHMRKM